LVVAITRRDLLYSLMRPSTTENGVLAEYRKHCALGTVRSPTHPALESILRPTRGFLVYQEQGMEILASIAGYDLAESDLLRREMGTDGTKRSLRRQDFCARAHDRGIDFKAAETIFSWLLDIVPTTFLRSHAVGIATLALRCASAKLADPAGYVARYHAQARAARLRLNRERGL
jgi:DNA polymerase-3 subunit alpha